MAAPITWRNVQFTGGNGSADLATAVSAFTSAGMSARENVTQAREAQDRDREAIDRAVGRLAFDNDGFTAADQASVAGLDYDAGALQAGIDASQLSQAQTDQNREAVRASLLLNSPERVAELDKLEKSLSQAQIAKIMEDVRVSQGLNSPEAIADYLRRLNEAHQMSLKESEAGISKTDADTQKTIQETAEAVATADDRQENIRADTDVKKATAGSLTQQTEEASQGQAARVEGEMLDNEQTRARIKQIQAQTGLIGEQTRDLFNSNSVFNERFTMEQENHMANLDNLNAQTARTKQITTQEGERFTDYQEDRIQKENTQRTLAKLAHMTPEELAKVDFSQFQNVDIPTLIEYRAATETQREDILRSQAQRLLAEDRRRWEGWEAVEKKENKDLRRRALEIENELNENRNDLTVEQVGALKEERAALRAQREREMAAHKTRQKANAAWNRHVDKHMSVFREQHEEKIRKASEGGILGFGAKDPAEVLAMERDGEEILALMQEDYENSAASIGFLQDYKRQNPDASVEGLNLSDVAQIVSTNSQRAADLQKITRQAAEERKTLTLNEYKKAAAGGDLSAFSYNPLTNEVQVLNKQQRAANSLSLQQAEQDILSKAGSGYVSDGVLDWLGRDGGSSAELSKKGQQTVKDLWNAVGKNREIWNQVTQDIEWNIEMFRQDRIENLPTSGEILEIASAYKAAALAEAKRMTEDGYTPASSAELFMEYLKN